MNLLKMLGSGPTEGLQMKLDTYKNLKIILGLTVSALLFSCSNEDKDKKNEGPDVQSIAQGVAPQGATVAQSGAFAIQDPVVLNNDGISTSVQGRLIGKLEEIEKALSFMSEDDGGASLALIQSDDEDSSPEDEDVRIDEGFSNLVAEIKKLLNDKVLIEKNIIEKSGDAVIYDLDGKLLCDDDKDKADCQKMIDDKLKLAVRFTSPDVDTIVAELLFGSERHAPISISASSLSLGVVLNASNIPPVVKLISEATGEELGFSFPKDWSGDLAYYLYRVKEGVFAVKAESKNGLDLSMTVDGKTASLKLKSSPELAEVTIDSVDESASVAVDMMGLDVSVPLEFLADGEDSDNPPSDEQRAKMKSLTLHLERITGVFKVDPKNKKVTITDIALSTAPYVLSHADKSIVEVSFTDVSQLNAVISEVEDSIEFEFNKSFKVAAKLKFSELSDILNDIPSDFLNETATIELNGSKPILVPMDEMMKVKSGELVLKSSAQNKTVKVAEGKCLASNDDEDVIWIDTFTVSSSCD